MNLQQLLDRLEPEVRAAFIAAVRDLRSEVAVGELAKAIEARRFDDAARLTGLDRAFWAPLDEVLRKVHAEGGRASIGDLPRILDPLTGERVVIRFDGRATEAERWGRDHIGDLITGLVEGQAATIRRAIMTGLEAGRGPRNLALDLVGRIGPSGRREGGIIGLSDVQAEYMQRARAELEALDPHYFTRTLRDRNLDGIVRRAIDSGEKLSAADVDRIAGRYADRLLAHRGTVIARNETISALHAGQYEGIRQLVDGGKVRPDQVTLAWSATGDNRTRETHQDMDGQEVQWGQPFVSPSGARLMHPHDTSLGAPLDEIIQCRCAMTVRINYLKR